MSANKNASIVCGRHSRSKNQTTQWSYIVMPFKGIYVLLKNKWLFVKTRYKHTFWIIYYLIHLFLKYLNFYSQQSKPCNDLNIYFFCQWFDDPGISHPDGMHSIYKCRGDMAFYLGDYKKALSCYDTCLGEHELLITLWYILALYRDRYVDICFCIFCMLTEHIFCICIIYYKLSHDVYVTLHQTWSLP